MLHQPTRSRIGLGLGTLVVFSLLLLTTAAAPALARKPVVAYVDSGGALRLYDAEVGMNVGAPPLTIPGSPPQFAISHSGRYVAYLDAASDVRLFDRATSIEVALPGIDVYASPRNLTVSDTGLIAFDNNGSGPARVYDAIAQSFTEVGFAANNGHRQTQLSGDGDILATTCLVNCEHFTNNEDYDVFLQDLSTDTDVPFPDTLGGAQKNEEHPCVDADASLVGTDIPNPTQRDVFLYDRAASAPVALPNLNDAAGDDIRCVLDSAGDYLGVTTGSGAFRVYERSSGTFLTLPAGVGPPAWLTAPYTAPPRTGPRRPVVAYVDPASGDFGLFDTETNSDLAPPPLPATGQPVAFCDLR